MTPAERGAEISAKLDQLMIILAVIAEHVAPKAKTPKPKKKKK